MSDEHEHDWRIDYTIPVMAVHPPIYTWRCDCGDTREGSGTEPDPVKPESVSGEPQPQ